MSLTYLKCKNAKGRDKPYKVSAGGGLYLEVMPNGSKYWQMKYRFDGKEKRLAFGVFDTVDIKDACDKRDEAIHVNAPVMLEILEKIEGRGVYETTRRALQYCGQILSYGVAIGCAERDDTPDLKDDLKTRRTERYAAISPKKLPEFLKDLESNKARMCVLLHDACHFQE